MAIVRTDIPQTYELCEQTILALTAKYAFLRTEVLTETAQGRNVRTLVIGNGPRKVIFSAAWHANEWITTPVLLKFVEEFAQALMSGGEIFGVNAGDLAAKVTVYTVPMVNPDGVDLVTGAIQPGQKAYEDAAQIAAGFPSIPFPDGWKADLAGVDLNLQYPAGWLRAREIKFLQGYNRPAPRDYVGRAPLTQREAKAMAGYTEYLGPNLVLALHSQGKEIYWRFMDYEVPGARELGEQMAQVSGYTLTEPVATSSYAGYKDWFIKIFRRPGYTVEVGSGTNPLPLSLFDDIYRDVLGILVTASVG